MRLDSETVKQYLKWNKSKRSSLIKVQNNICPLWSSNRSGWKHQLYAQWVLALCPNSTLPQQTPQNTGWHWFSAGSHLCAAIGWRPIKAAAFCTSSCVGKLTCGMRYGSRPLIGQEVMLSGWSSVVDEEAKSLTGPGERSWGGLVRRWRPEEFIFLSVVQVNCLTPQNLWRKDRSSTDKCEGTPTH